VARRSSAATAPSDEHAPDLPESLAAQDTLRPLLEESARVRIDREIRACAIQTRLRLWAPVGVLGHGC
jgi:hypothetical protein